jgi:hypothetical protein
MGFHKILKKHDKQLPHSPCRQFYIAHLHNQPWVQGNYSDLLVSLSAVYSDLRGDAAPAQTEEGLEGMVRSNAKYWVRMSDVSTVKHHILQHLPVFQATQGTADYMGDAQLVNSGGCRKTYAHGEAPAGMLELGLAGTGRVFPPSPNDLRAAATRQVHGRHHVDAWLPANATVVHCRSTPMHHANTPAWTCSAACQRMPTLQMLYRSYQFFLQSTWTTAVWSCTGLCTSWKSPTIHVFPV